MFSTSIKKALLSCICGLMLPATGLTDAEYDAIEEYENRFWQVLEQVNDKESADAAAQKLLHLPHADVAEKALLPQWWTDGNESAPLVKACFYGSAALAEALGFPAEDSIIPSPLAPGIVSMIQMDMLRSLTKPIPESRKKAEKLLAQGKGLSPDVLMTLPNEVASSISGGCGFTPESAWGIAADDFRKCQFTATQLILYAFPCQTRAEQRMEFRGNKRFLVYTVSLLRGEKKYEVEQWFDISAIAPVYPETMRKQAANDLHELASELHSALFCIWDEESASEQVPAIASLYEKCQQKARICEERQSIWMLWMNAFDIPRRERIASQLINIEKENAFGSDTLLRLLQRIKLPLYQ